MKNIKTSAYIKKRAYRQTAFNRFVIIIINLSGHIVSCYNVQLEIKYLFDVQLISNVVLRLNRVLKRKT